MVTRRTLLAMLDNLVHDKAPGEQSSLPRRQRSSGKFLEFVLRSRLPLDQPGFIVLRSSSIIA